MISSFLSSLTMEPGIGLLCSLSEALGKNPTIHSWKQSVSFIVVIDFGEFVFGEDEVLASLLVVDAVDVFPAAVPFAEVGWRAGDMDFLNDEFIVAEEIPEGLVVSVITDILSY